MIVAEQDSVTNDDLTIPPGLDRRGEPRAERREDIKSIRSRAARLGYTVKRRLDLLESSQETGQPIQIESPCGTPLFQIEPPTNEPVHAQTGFDYSGLTANASELAKRAAAKIQQHQRRTSLEIIEIGTDLIKVKGALEHGHFIAWLEAEFGWTDRTARNYMRAALVFGAKSETVSVLPSRGMRGRRCFRRPPPRGGAGGSAGRVTQRCCQHEWVHIGVSGRGLILSKGAPRTAACPRPQFRGIPETFFVERLHGKAGRLEGFKEVPVIGWRHC